MATLIFNFYPSAEIEADRPNDGDTGHRPEVLRDGLSPLPNLHETRAMLADELAIALQPLHSAFESAGALRDFLEDLGWEFDVAPAAIDRLRTPVEQVFAILNDPDGVDASDIPRILTSVRAVLDAISGLASDAELAADFKNEFPRQLVDYLVVDYLLLNQARVGYLLIGLGIISVEDRPEAGTRPPYVFRGFAWERLPDLLHDPRSHLKSVYRWGQSNFDSARLIESLAGFLEAWHQRVDHRRG